MGTVRRGGRRAGLQPAHRRVRRRPGKAPTSTAAGDRRRSQRGDDWAQTNRVTNRATGTTTRVTRTDEGAAVSRNPRGAGNGGFVAAGDDGNVYAGRDGNVYKNDGSGWQQGRWRRQPSHAADGRPAQ